MVGSERTLEFAPFHSVSSVLGRVLFPDSKMLRVSSMTVNLAAVVLFLCRMFVLGDKRNKVVDANLFHVSLTHALLKVLHDSAEQHRIRLVGELASCSGCSKAKGIRAATPYYTTVRAREPMEPIHIDTAGPYLESIGGSRYIVLFNDSTCRLQRP